MGYDPVNHETWCGARRELASTRRHPDIEVDGPPPSCCARLGFHAGAIRRGQELRGLGKPSAGRTAASQPFPKNLGDVLGRFDTVLVPEMNLGQLAFILRGNYRANIVSCSKVQGKPFRIQELVEKMTEVLEGKAS